MTDIEILAQEVLTMRSLQIEYSELMHRKQFNPRIDGKWCVGYQGWYDCVGDLYDSVIWIYQLLISEGYLDEFCNKG